MGRDMDRKHTREISFMAPFTLGVGREDNALLASIQTNHSIHPNWKVAVYH
jgi:hypothetical protein